MVCRCGYQNEPDDFYCAQCGRRLTGKKSGKGWIVAIVVVLALAAGALAGWFLIPWENFTSEPEETQEETVNEDELPDPSEALPSDTTEPEADDGSQEGWDEDRLCYYKDGAPLKGLQEIEGEFYYFDPETGVKQTGWVEIESGWHYFTEDGPAPGEGWYSDDQGWFYLEKNGRHHRESPLVDEDNKREYTLNEEGYLTRLEYLELVCIETDDLVGGRNRPILMLSSTLSGCTGLTFREAEGAPITAMDSAVWEIWIRLDGEWIKVKDAASQDGSGNYVLSFSEPQSFDAVCIFGSKDQKIMSTLTNVIVEY